MKTKNGKPGMAKQKGSKPSDSCKPLKGKKVYIDAKGQAGIAAIERDLTLLGACVEKFFTKDVNYLITSQKDTRGDAAAESSPALSTPSPFNLGGGVDSPRTNNSPAPSAGCATKSRGKALAQKACSQFRGTSDVISNAQKWGVRVVSFAAVKKWLKREMEKLPKTVPEKTTKKLKPLRVKTLKSPFLKFESTTKQYKPCYVEMDTFPHVSVDSRVPFGVEGEQPRGERAEVEVTEPNEEADELTSPSKKAKRPTKKSAKRSSPTMGKLVTAGELRRMREQTRRAELKRGYCECCNVRYEDIDEHVLSPAHQEFIQRPINFRSLDLLIARGPNIERFLSDIEMFHSSNNTEEQLTDGCDNDDINLLSEHNDESAHQGEPQDVSLDTTGETVLESTPAYEKNKRGRRSLSGDNVLSRVMTEKPMTDADTQEKGTKTNTLINNEKSDKDGEDNRKRRERKSDSQKSELTNKNDAVESTEVVKGGEKANSENVDSAKKMKRGQSSSSKMQNVNSNQNFDQLVSGDATQETDKRSSCRENCVEGASPRTSQIKSPSQRVKSKQSHTEETPRSRRGKKRRVVPDDDVTPKPGDSPMHKSFESTGCTPAKHSRKSVTPRSAKSPINQTVEVTPTNDKKASGKETGRKASKKSKKQADAPSPGAKENILPVVKNGKKLKLKEKWRIMSNRSMRQILQASEVDEPFSFFTDGNAPDLPTDVSYIDISQIDIDDVSDADWFYEGLKADPPMFSVWGIDLNMSFIDPSSDYDWESPCEVFIKRHVEKRLTPPINKMIMPRIEKSICQKSRLCEKFDESLPQVDDNDNNIDDCDDHSDASIVFVEEVNADDLCISQPIHVCKDNSHKRSKNKVARNGKQLSLKRSDKSMALVPDKKMQSPSLPIENSDNRAIPPLPSKVNNTQADHMETPSPPPPFKNKVFSPLTNIDGCTPRLKHMQLFTSTPARKPKNKLGKKGSPKRDSSVLDKVSVPLVDSKGKLEIDEDITFNFSSPSKGSTSFSPLKASKFRSITKRYRRPFSQGQKHHSTTEFTKSSTSVISKALFKKYSNSSFDGEKRLLKSASNHWRNFSLCSIIATAPKSRRQKPRVPKSPKKTLVGSESDEAYLIPSNSSLFVCPPTPDKNDLSEYDILDASDDDFDTQPKRKANGTLKSSAVKRKSTSPLTDSLKRESVSLMNKKGKFSPLNSLKRSQLRSKFTNKPLIRQKCLVKVVKNKDVDNLVGSNDSSLCVDSAERSVTTKKLLRVDREKVKAVLCKKVSKKISSPRKSAIKGGPKSPSKTRKFTHKTTEKESPVKHTRKSPFANNECKNVRTSLLTNAAEQTTKLPVRELFGGSSNRLSKGVNKIVTPSKRHGVTRSKATDSEINNDTSSDFDTTGVVRFQKRTGGKDVSQRTRSSPKPCESNSKHASSRSSVRSSGLLSPRSLTRYQLNNSPKVLLRTRSIKCVA